ncbi:sodium:proton antiporter [Bacteroidetes/Chlorobi group bacterium Naka2016]|nr:MAG: sodium:proton antiporter [Bacteroidetes/Chlorobi group bacterium Naka2016]
MENAIIITLCVLLIISYLFDLTFMKTKIPSVILLLFLGWLVKQITTLLRIQIPDLSPALPILGTVGLILIVLEGSLELKLESSKAKMILSSFLGALLPMVLLIFLLAYLMSTVFGYDFWDSVLSSIPLCVISSAIAIPSVRNFPPTQKEFVIYESSFSDIIGVLIFNFFVVNRSIGIPALIEVSLQFVIMFLVSVVATFSLATLLRRIEHHVKFVPVVLLIVLIYAVSKFFHLPALVFILIFGLILSNIEDFKNIKFLQRFCTFEIQSEVKKFMDLIAEGTFLVRSLFFLLFGYFIETSELVNIVTLPWALAIVLLIFLLRAVQLKILRLPLQPLIFVAPRGLITILLFLSIEPTRLVPFVNKSLVIQIIILTSLILMFGSMITKTETIEEKEVVNESI